jgi:hypothetical protein
MMPCVLSLSPLARVRVPDKELSCFTFFYRKTEKPKSSSLSLQGKAIKKSPPFQSCASQENQRKLFQVPESSYEWSCTQVTHKKKLPPPLSPEVSLPSGHWNRGALIFFKITIAPADRFPDHSC